MAAPLADSKAPSAVRLTGGSKPAEGRRFLALHAKQTLAAGDFRGDPELVAILTKGAPESIKWLEKIGVQYRSGVYQIYGGLWPRCHNPLGQSGSDYIKAAVSYAKRTEGGITFTCLEEKPAADIPVTVEVYV